MSNLKEITRLKSQVDKMKATLNDEGFLSKAPQKVIELNKSKLTKFELDLVRELEVVVGELRKRLDYNDGLEGVDAVDRISWYIQLMRDKKYCEGVFFSLFDGVDYSHCEFDEKYFDYVYNPRATDLELAELLDCLTEK